MADRVSLAGDPTVDANANAIVLRVATVALVGVCLGCFLIDSLASALSSWWRYWGLLPVTALYVLCFSRVGKPTDVTARHISIPSVLFLLGMGFFIYIGSLDHWLQVLVNNENLYLPTLTWAYQLIAFVLTAWALGYMAGRWFWNPRPRKTQAPSSPRRGPLVWSQRRLFVVAIFWSVVSSVAFAVFYFVIVGYSPVLRGVSPNADSELRSMMFGRGHQVSMIAFNATNLAMLTSGLHVVCFKKHRALMAMLFLIAAVWFLLWGARLYIALPAMICLVLMVARYHWSLRRTGAILVGLAVVAVCYGLARNRTFTGVDIANRVKVENLSDARGEAGFCQTMADFHAGPEFRDALGVMAHLDAVQEQYEPTAYFRGMFLTAVPGRLLGVVGLDKNILFDEEGSSIGWIAARITRGLYWTAIRPGLVGETLVAFGPIGLGVVFVLYGLLFARLDVLSLRAEPASPRGLLIYGTAMIFTYAVVASTHSTYAKFWYFLYGSLLTTLLAAVWTRSAVRPESDISLTP